MFDGEDTSPDSKQDADREPEDKALSTELPKRLKNRAPKRTLPFAARTSAVMRVSNNGGRVHSKTVRLPPVLETEPVALALINGLQVKPDKSAISAYGRWRSVEKFLPFAADNLVEGRLPKDIFNLYRTARNKQGSAQRSVQSAVSTVKVPLKAGATNPDFMATLDDDAQDHIRSVVANIPSIPYGVGKKRPGMGELFEDLPDDRPLFDGLRDFATWSLSELQSHRDELLQDADVRAALDEARTIVGDDVNALAYKSRTLAPRDQWNPSTLCNAIFEAVCRSELLTLKVRLLLGDSRYRERLFGDQAAASIELMVDVNVQLARCRLQRGAFFSNNEHIQLVTRRPLGFAQCDLLSLVKPTDAEHICVQWLLAGVAVQTSGQQSAQVGDYIIQASSTYLDYTKNRSKKKHKHTDSIRKKSAMGMALNGFIALKEAQSGDKSRLMEANYLARPPVSVRPAWRFLLATTRAQSAIRQAFLERHPMGEDFLMLLTKLRVHGDLFANFSSQRGMLKKRLKAGRLTATEHEQALKTLTRESPVTTRKTLAPDHIRNTRIALQRSTPGLTAAEREAEERAQASSNGHTSDVMKYVYRLRDSGQFRTKERVEFAAAVGEIATTLARQIRDAYASTKVLTLESVAGIVGLEHGFESEGDRTDRVLAELDVNGYRLNYFGAHSKGKDRIVVAEPVTVALMLSACDTYIARAKNDQLLQEERAEAVLEYTLISALLEEMPDDIVDSGRGLFERKKFPALIPLLQEK